MNILERANQIVQERGLSYGSPSEDFYRTANMLTALGFKINDEPILPKHIPIIMTCVKLSRETFSHKDDNLIDVCGYMRTLEMIHDNL